FKVVQGGSTIGTIYSDIDTQPGKHIILAGRRWIITDVDTAAKVLLVQPSPAGVPPMFECGEVGETHSRIHAAMRDVLMGADVPVYLDATGKSLLASARQAATDVGL